MLIFLIVLFFIAVVSLKFCKNDVSSALSREQTQTIKGFFVVTVFFSHFCTYVHFDTWYDFAMLEYCDLFGQLMVAPFLFYSGYGIFESVKKKGSGYIKTMPRRRILKVLLHFDFAVILFWLLDLAIGRSVSLSEFVLSLVAWESIGNSNWFIFVIICAYTIAFAGLRLFKGRLVNAFVFITVMSLVYIVVIARFKPCYWFDTILAFPLGCALSLFKDKFNVVVSKKFIALGGGVLSFLVFFLLKSGYIPSTFVNGQIALFAFSFFVVFFSLNVRVSSKILTWFGAYVFELYILQRIPMNYFAYLNLNEANIYVFFVLSFVFTVVLSILFSKWNKFFDSFFLDKAKS